MELLGRGRDGVLLATAHGVPSQVCLRIFARSHKHLLLANGTEERLVVARTGRTAMRVRSSVIEAKGVSAVVARKGQKVAHATVG